MATAIASLVSPDAVDWLVQRVDAGVMLWVGIAGVAATLWWTPTLLASVLGPSSFVMEAHQLRFGRRRVAYDEIVALRWHAALHTLHVCVKHGAPLRLRWSLWHSEPAWDALLAERTAQRLLDAACTALRAGSRVTFGKKVALDGQCLCLGRKRIPLSGITDLCFQSGFENGIAYRRLKVYTVARVYGIDEKKIENPHILLDAIRAAREVLQQR